MRGTEMATAYLAKNAVTLKYWNGNSFNSVRVETAQVLTHSEQAFIKMVYDNVKVEKFLRHK